MFWLSRVQNLSNDEIAGKLNISKRTVENQITQALRNLRVSYTKLSTVSSR
ncbi:sigma factor-like helix-turn-helix DNA-binding protein [Mucilaginibacter sp. 22184]|uniref:sigma factor-like helix-turn-helix DNA-binding protein n=1 Tax=Mucilaginibacter sp. 22184 TaxID=3453887 RepID=UPI003F8626C7